MKQPVFRLLVGIGQVTGRAPFAFDAGRLHLRKLTTEDTTECEGKREVEQPEVGPQGETSGSERVKGLTECIDGEVFHCFVKAKSCSLLLRKNALWYLRHLFLKKGDGVGIHVDGTPEFCIIFVVFLDFF